MRGQAVVCFLLIGLTVVSLRAGAIAIPTTQPADSQPINSQWSKPVHLSLQPEAPSVYAAPSAKSEAEGLNEGGVHVDLDVRFMTDYVFRGLDRSDGTGLTLGSSSSGFGHEDGPNLQFDGKLSWDLAKFPHPYIELFVNVFDSDPVSRFQVIQPKFGFEWNLRPVVIEAGQQTFIYPERDDLNTAEVFTKLTLDDSYFLRTDQPLLSPYVMAAYDYDLYHGWYLEAGVKHDFPIEDTGVTITALADVAYVLSDLQFSTDGKADTGLQHYDLGLIGSFSLNSIFGTSRRYGDFSVKGYLFYTDGIDNDLLADTQLWGGVGIAFKY
jgi:hypothetical protein